MINPQILTLAAAAVFALSALGVILRMRHLRKVSARKEVVATPTADPVAQSHRRIESAVNVMSEQIKEMRSDLSWLTSERMIDQAINMAREGESGAEISRQTGISADELVAMQAFRRH